MTYCNLLIEAVKSAYPVEHSHFYNAIVNGKEVGKYGLSFYEDIKAVGIGSFEIYPQYRNKGYGTTVIKQIIDKYKDKYDWIYCFVEADNEGAIRFYKRIGTVSTTKTNSYKVGSTEYRNSKGQYLVTLYKKSNEFDEKELNQITNIQDRIKYCDNRLKYLARGRGKRVYAIDDNYVLKLAYNRNGYTQNQLEIKLSKYKYPFLAQVKSYGDKATFIIAERCYITLERDSINDKYISEIERVTSYPPNIIWFLGYTLVVGGLNNYKKVKQDLIKVCDTITQHKTDSSFSGISNYQYGLKMCDITSGISQSNQNIIKKKFADLLWFVSHYARKNKSHPYYNIDYRKYFNMIDTGEYKRIQFINDILKYPGIENIVDFRDCFNIFNTGIVKRNGKEYLVVLDYGYSP